MDSKEAAEILREYNQWRRTQSRNVDIPVQPKCTPEILGQAIDVVVNSLEHTQIGGYDPERFLPPSGKRVLVKVMYGTSGKPWTTVAAYIAKHTEKADHDSFEGELDYDEETDEFYLPEGWYEHGLYTQENYRITDTVLVWAYLPDDGIVIDEQAKVNAEKAAKWDALDERIGAFYNDVVSPEDDEAGLVGIGEAAAHAFGYL